MTNGKTDSEQQHEHRVLGGYKAALHNPNVSAEMKEHAAEVLASHGVEVKHNDLPAHNEEHHTHDHDHGTRHAHVQPKEVGEAETHHQNRVLGGYKATLNNPNVSEEAKERAREVLKEHGEDAE